MERDEEGLVLSAVLEEKVRGARGGKEGKGGGLEGVGGG